VPAGAASLPMPARAPEDCPQPGTMGAKRAIVNRGIERAQHGGESMGYSKNETSSMETSAAHVPLGPAAIANDHATPVIVAGSIV